MFLTKMLTVLSRIALHSAGTEGGAQNYPQCFNLQVTGSGSDVPAGVLGTKLYSPTDPGILVNIYTSLSTYVGFNFSWQDLIELLFPLALGC